MRTLRTFCMDDGGQRVHPFTRFLAVHIGAQIVPDTAAEVYPVTPGAPPIAPANPDPLLTAGATGVAAGRGLRLIAGPLSGFWTEGVSR